jgi:hypothetical protein
MSCINLRHLRSASDYMIKLIDILRAKFFAVFFRLMSLSSYSALIPILILITLAQAHSIYCAQTRRIAFAPLHSRARKRNPTRSFA